MNERKMTPQKRNSYDSLLRSILGHFPFILASLFTFLRRWIPTFFQVWYIYIYIYIYIFQNYFFSWFLCHIICIWPRRCSVYVQYTTQTRWLSNDEKRLAFFEDKPPKILQNSPLFFTQCLIFSTSSSLLGIIDWFEVKDTW